MLRGLLGVGIALGVGCGGGSGSPVDATSTIDINGTLVGRAADNGPLSSREVVVIDAEGTVTKLSTGADGTFHASGVVTPYDLSVPYVRATPTDIAFPVYYAGLTRPDPTIHGNDYATPPNDTEHQSNVTFTVNACLNCEVHIGGPSIDDRFDGTGAASAYSFPYRWFGDTTTAPFHVFVRDTSGNYVSYVDVPAVTLVDNGTTALGTLTLASVAQNKMLAIDATLPASYTFAGGTIEVYEADHSRVGYDDFSTTTNTVAPYPDLANLSVSANVGANGPSGEQTYAYQLFPTTTTATGLTVTLAAAPVPLTPIDRATGVDDTQPLTWSPYTSQTVYSLGLGSPTDGIGINTADTSLDLGRLAKGDIALVPGATYTWTVQAGGWVSSVDDLAAPSSSPVDPYAIYATASSKVQTFTRP